MKYGNHQSNLIIHPAKMIPLLSSVLLSGPGIGAEICNGISSKTIDASMSLNAGDTCTATQTITLDSGVTVPDNISLYAPVVRFFSPVYLQGNLHIAQSDPATTPSPLNDTGITWCADDSDNDLSCPVTGYPGQDAEYGRDVTHNDDSDGHAGFSFTKLDAEGNPLPASATSWSCVKDNVTGLIWEVKTDDGGLHDKDDLYNWYSTYPNTNGGGMGYADDDGAICYGYDPNDPATYCNTQAYVIRVNQAGWCGYHDWRMPTIEELRSLVDYSLPSPGPTIDTDFFPNQVNSQMWSSSPDASHPLGVWLLDFGYGGNWAGGKDMSQFFVRVVRGGK